mmetsp:Transcript_13444/g.52652  ORF Transcript_13444/g.52652 Transcript_13444/m.52652 type:complete len:308 (+) Transcript_13444:130-1053(+)
MRAVELGKLPLALACVDEPRRIRGGVDAHTETTRQSLPRASRRPCPLFESPAASRAPVVVDLVILRGRRRACRVHPRVHRRRSQAVCVRHRSTPSLPRHLLTHHPRRVRLVDRRVVLVRAVAVVHVLGPCRVGGHLGPEAALGGGGGEWIDAGALLRALEDSDPRPASVGDDSVDEARAPMRHRRELRRQRRGGSRGRGEPRGRGFGSGDDREELRELHLTVRRDADSGHGAFGVLDGGGLVAQHRERLANLTCIQRAGLRLVDEGEYLAEGARARPGDVGAGGLSPRAEPVRHLGGVPADHRRFVG